jgi:hypothetical protein
MNMLNYVSGASFSFFVSETWSHYVAQAGLELMILLPQPPEFLGLQVCTTMKASEFLPLIFSLFWDKFRELFLGLHSVFLVLYQDKFLK